ncbi:hypothetical protein [Pseudonocardia sp. TRM90224]|uniref:hypothetical protein n=1 Tax=Pseudonocardia sp. TRM90224 TaxID=2812678 RepID=UPI001E42AF0A|nr:hypothetical protein [Pseudonocardia sp. TRM90224]
MPEHLVPAAQSMVALAIDHADAPATVGPPAFADEPGAVGAGVVAGCSPFLPCSSDGCGCCSPVVSCETVAFAVDLACTTGAITFASGPVEAPEFVTAWHTPPVTPVQVPSLRAPRGSPDTLGSVAVAELVTFPSHNFAPSHTRTAPATDAADGPAGRRARLILLSSPANASAAPGPLDALDFDTSSHPPVPPVQVAVPSDVRGAAVPSNAVVAVLTVPEQSFPASQLIVAVDDDVDDGPVSG